MPHLSARIVGAAATLALVAVPVATAAPAGATARASSRDTAAMDMAEIVGGAAAGYSEHFRLDGRSTKSVRAVLELMNAPGNFPFKIIVTGLTDRNHDGLDDDGKVKVRVLDNAATLTLHNTRAYSVADAGFVFHNRASVLKESAQAFDRVLRLAASFGEDSWDMSLIKDVKDEMPAGVRVVSDYDGNHDGYDDDGRLTFLANGKAVTLTIGNTGKQVGKVTYGPTWRTKAPNRAHHPLPRPQQASSGLPKQPQTSNK